MKVAWVWLIAGAGILAASLTALAWLAVMLTNSGLTADAEGTSGYTTGGEIVLGGAGIVGCLAGVTLVIVGFGLRQRARLALGDTPAPLGAKGPAPNLRAPRGTRSMTRARAAK